MQAQNDNIQKLACTILKEVERMIEEDLILELKSNLPRMFKVLSKISKLDISLAFVEYVQSSQVPLCRPILINSPKVTLNPYLKVNQPALYLSRGYNPLLSHFQSNVP